MATKQDTVAWIRTRLATEINKPGEVHHMGHPVANGGTEVIRAGTVIKVGMGRYTVDADIAPGASGVATHRAFDSDVPMCGPDDVYLSHEYIHDKDGNCLGRGVQSISVAELADAFASELMTPINVTLPDVAYQKLSAVADAKGGTLPAALQRWRTTGLI